MMSSNQDAGKPATSPDHVHDLGFAGALARLSMMESGVLMRLARPRARTTPPTSGDTTMTFGKVEALLDVARHHRGSEEVVGRNIEETLDLGCVEIEGHHAVDAGAGDQVGDQLG